MAVRYDPDNCMALCHGCHVIFENHKPTDYREFMIQWLGQDRYDALVERSRQITKLDKSAVADRIKALLAEVGLDTGEPRQVLLAGIGQPISPREKAKRPNIGLDIDQSKV